MKYCAACGSSMEISDNFCTECGHKVGSNNSSKKEKNTPNDFIAETYKNTFKFKGRVGRKDFWSFVLYQLSLLLIFLLLNAISENVLSSDLSAVINMISLVPLLLYVVGIVSLVALSIRRLHDTGNSGWLYLLTFVPFGGVVLLIFYCTKGDSATNKYGQVNQ